MDDSPTPFEEDTPYPDVRDDPYAGLRPTDPFAGLRASSTGPRQTNVQPSRPVEPDAGSRRGGIVVAGLGLLIVAIVAMAFVLWPGLQDRLSDGTDVSPTPSETTPEQTPGGGVIASAGDIETALAAAGHSGISVVVTDGLAILSGTVVDEQTSAAVAALVAQQPGIAGVDNQLQLPVDPLTSDQLTAAAADALAAAGFARITVDVDSGVATLGGFVPIGALEDGFFAYVARAEQVVTRIDGIDSVVNQVGIKGNAAQLRNQLNELIEDTPIVFDSGSAALSAEAAGVLDEVATAIIGQPGLQVFIAGHTDTAGASETNEALARGRAGSVFQYLAQRGVPVNRMFVVAYGELFPDADDAAASRRIEFEVGG